MTRVSDILRPLWESNIKGVEIKYSKGKTKEQIDKFMGKLNKAIERKKALGSHYDKLIEDDRLNKPKHPWWDYEVYNDYESTWWQCYETSKTLYDWKPVETQLELECDMFVGHLDGINQLGDKFVLIDYKCITPNKENRQYYSYQLLLYLYLCLWNGRQIDELTDIFLLPRTKHKRVSAEFIAVEELKHNWKVLLSHDYVKSYITKEELIDEWFNKKLNN
jgi:hypothetical protein